MFRSPIRNHAFDRMGERFGSLIDPDHFLGRSAFDIPWETASVPAANLRKTENSFVLELAVPGFRKEDIVIELKKDVLTVKGAKSKTEDVGIQAFVIYEFESDKFERRFKLYPGISIEDISAKYENGILKLSFRQIDKTGEKPEKQIAIH